MTESISPFLRLPLEIRLIIYEYLLFPSKSPSSSHTTSVANLMPDYHTYYSGDTNDTPFTLAVRTIDPYAGSHNSRSWKRRSTYYIRTALITGASGPFLTTTTPTTYRVLLSPFTAHLRHTVPSLLYLNHQIHIEASKVLYSNYTFSFHTSVEAAVPFFGDLTPTSRACVRHIALTKKGLPYTREFDHLEWAALCKYLSSNLCLDTLSLSVVVGKPGETGWDDVAPISKEAFALMQRMRKDWGSMVGGADLTWVEQLFEVKGLRRVDVRALVERCPGAANEVMAFWFALSKSVEAGFAEWIRGAMVASQE